MRNQIEFSKEGEDFWYNAIIHPDGTKQPPVIQGFVDQYDIFLTREEAYVLAVEHGQIERVAPEMGTTLISEMLY